MALLNRELTPPGNQHKHAQTTNQCNGKMVREATSTPTNPRGNDGNPSTSPDPLGLLWLEEAHHRPAAREAPKRQVPIFVLTRIIFTNCPPNQCINTNNITVL